MVYVFLADGFEEVEALAVVDMLRRAKIEMQTVGITGKIVTGAHNIPVTSDITGQEATTQGLDMVVLPGGVPGTPNLEKSAVVQSMIDFAIQNDKWVAAICAAPSILGHKGLLKGKNATAYPTFQDQLEGAYLSEEYVCVDGKIVTGRGAGVAVDFGLKLVELLCGKACSDEIRASIQCRK